MVGRCEVARPNPRTAIPRTVDVQPRQGLTWSGEAATPQLAKTMLELAKQQPYGKSPSSIKPMQVDHVVTVSHGTASLGEVMEAVMAYYNALPPAMGRAPMQMTIVCLDENDYTDVQTVPHQFNSSPTTARAPTEIGVRTRLAHGGIAGTRNGGRLRPALGVRCTLQKQRSRFNSDEGFTCANRVLGV